MLQTHAPFRLIVLLATLGLLAACATSSGANATDDDSKTTSQSAPSDDDASAAREAEPAQASDDTPSDPNTVIELGFKKGESAGGEDEDDVEIVHGDDQEPTEQASCDVFYEMSCKAATDCHKLDEPDVSGRWACADGGCCFHEARDDDSEGPSEEEAAEDDAPEEAAGDDAPEEAAGDDAPGGETGADDGATSSGGSCEPLHEVACASEQDCHGLDRPKSLGHWECTDDGCCFQPERLKKDDIVPL